MHKYEHSVLGGTFDHLHAGHEKFISAAYAKSSLVSIGLTSDEFSNYKEFPYSIQSYQTRKKTLLDFLQKGKFLSRTKIIKINDPFGTSIHDSSFDAIFVTNHGLPNAKLINIKRKNSNLKPLAIEKVDFLRGPDGKIISSTRIRSGEIDRAGKPYIELFKKTLKLPASKKPTVKDYPRGVFFTDVKSAKKQLKDTNFLISVGDVVFEKLTSLKNVPNIAIVDLKSNRQLTGKLIKYSKAVVNIPGTIDRKAVRVIESAIKKGSEVIKVEGEEDLLALPAALLAPLGAFIIYGRPASEGHFPGVVLVKVTEEVKEEVKEILRNFRQ